MPKIASTSQSIKLLLLLLLTASSCSYNEKSFSFSPQERSLLTPFKKGDTLYFDGSDKRTDTVVILGLDSTQKRETGWIMAQPAHNEIWVAAKCLPGTDTSNLITITKLPQKDKVEFYFAFRQFLESTSADLGQPHSDTLDLDGLRITDYYRIGGDLPDSAAGTDMECIYWKKKSGLVGYKFHNGVVYRRRQ